MAAREGHLEVANMLLEKGANIHDRSDVSDCMYIYSYIGSVSFMRKVGWMGGWMLLMVKARKLIFFRKIS